MAVVYALIVPPLFYRELAWKDLPGILADSARLSGVIGLIIGLVGAFGWVLTYSKFPCVIASAVGHITPPVRPPPLRRHGRERPAHGEASASSSSRHAK